MDYSLAVKPELRGRIGLTKPSAFGVLPDTENVWAWVHKFDGRYAV